MAVPLQINSVVLSPNAIYQRAWKSLLQSSAFVNSFKTAAAVVEIVMQVGMAVAGGASIFPIFAGGWQGGKAAGEAVLLSIFDLGIAGNIPCPNLDQQLGYFGRTRIRCPS